MQQETHGRVACDALSDDDNDLLSVEVEFDERQSQRLRVYAALAGCTFASAIVSLVSIALDASIGPAS